MARGHSDVPLRDISSTEISRLILVGEGADLVRIVLIVQFAGRTLQCFLPVVLIGLGGMERRLPSA